jgi:hypothetical protein
MPATGQITRNKLIQKKTETWKEEKERALQESDLGDTGVPEWEEKNNVDIPQEYLSRMKVQQRHF